MSDKMSTINISIFNIVGSGLCVDAQDGDSVFKVISRALQQNQSVVISFKNVDMLTTAFLNTAIGQLYRDFSEEHIRNFLDVADITDSDLASLRRVVEGAKIYYSDPSWLEESVKNIMGDDQ